MSLVRTPTEAQLARRILYALSRGGLNRQQIKSRLSLPPRARRVNDMLRALDEAGIISSRYAYPTSVYSLARVPEPGELDPPRRDFEVLTEEADAGAGLEVRAVRFLDTDELRIQVRRVTRFPGGGVRARHVLGVTPDVARQLARALRCVADEVEP